MATERYDYFRCEACKKKHRKLKGRHNTVCQWCAMMEPAKYKEKYFTKYTEENTPLVR